MSSCTVECNCDCDCDSDRIYESTLVGVDLRCSVMTINVNALVAVARSFSVL